MININEMNVTNIQFFDYSNESDPNCVKQYSANIILDEKLVIQLSGNMNEAHKPSIPLSDESYYNDSDLQDEAYEELHGVEKFLEDKGIENNFNYLSENGECINF